MTMLVLRETSSRDSPADDELVLSFDQRRRSRFRTALASGREVAIVLPRGTSIRDGDCLRGTDDEGRHVNVRIVAASEPLYRVTGPNLTRAAYHLGNRHVPLEIRDGHLCIERDEVLRQMLLGLGYEVEEATSPFEPEPGAYES